MFLILYLVILFLTIFITKIKYKTIIKSNILFTGMWCFLAGISTLGLYGLFKPSPLVHLYAIASILIFNAVFLSHNKIKRLSRYNANIRGAARLKAIYIANVISWVYLSGFLVKSINIIRSYGFRGIRAYAFDSSMGLATTTELLFIQWVIAPIFTATVLIAMVYMVINRKAQFLTLIAVADVALYSLLFGGRYLIVKMMMYYIFAFLIVKVIDLEKIKNKKLNLVFIGLIVTTIIVVTSQRNWGDTSLIENSLVYYVGSFTFLDVLLNELNWSYSPLYGMGTFGFIVNLVIAPFAILFKIPYRGSDYLITQITAIPRFISPTQSYNAMTTMIYPFFRDFGFLGIIIGTSFLAWFISFIEKKFMKNKDMLFLCLYVYLAFVLFNSVLLYDLLFPSAFITMALLFLFIKNKSLE